MPGDSSQNNAAQDNAAADNAGKDAAATNITAEDASLDALAGTVLKARNYLLPLAGATTPDANNLSIAALLNTVDLNGDGANDTYSAPTADANNSAQSLKVTASFSASTAITERTISIRLEQGLLFKGAMGFNANMQWTGTELGQLAGRLQGTYAPDPDIVLSHGAMPQGSGSITYRITDDSQSVIDLATVTVQVAANPWFSATDTTRTFTNAIKVAASQKVSGSATTSPELVLENYTLSTAMVPGVIGIDTALNNKIVAPGDAIAVPFSVYAANAYYASLDFALRLPQGISLNTTTPLTRYTTSSIPVSSAGVELVSATQNAAQGTDVVIRLHNFFGDTSSSRFYLNVTVDANATEGAHLFSLVPGVSTFTPYGAGATPASAGAITYFPWPPNLVVSTAAPSMNFSAGGMRDRGYVDPALMTDRETLYLATPLIKNPSVSATGTVGFKVEYPAQILVRDVWLPVGNDKVEKLKVTLTNSTVLSYAELTTGLRGTVGMDRSLRYNLDFLSPAIDQSVGIASLEYESSGFAGAYGNVTNAYAVRNGLFAAWGRFTAPPAPASFTIAYTSRMGGLPDTAQGDTWPAAVRIESSVSSTVRNLAIGIGNAAITSGAANVVQAGDTRHVSMSANVGAFLSNDVGFVKGLAYYLRETPYLTIDKDSIKVYQIDERVGDTLVLQNDVTVTESWDNGSDNGGTSSRVWKVTAPTARLSSYITPRLRVNIQFDFTVKADAPSTSVRLADIIRLRPVPDSNGTAADPNGYPAVAAGGSGTGTQIITDTFDVDTARIGKTTVYAVPDTAQSFNIIAYPDFSVRTAMELVIPPSYNSGWSDFTGSNYLALNQYGTVSYRLRAVNNNDAPAGTFAVHIPIPKTTASAADWGGGSNGVSAAFEFNTAIRSEVNTGGYGDVEVLYSDAYLTDTSAGADLSSFKAWDQFADKRDIKTVRIAMRAGTEFAASATHDFTFDLDILDKNGVVATSATALDDLAPLSGKLNRYCARFSVAGTGFSKVGFSSQPVGVRLNTGIIRGLVYNDVNQNNAYDAGTDTGRAGVQVWAYSDAGYTTPLDAAQPYVVTNSEGLFSIMGANAGQNVYLRVDNPAGNADTLRFVGSLGSAAVSLNLAALQPGASLDAAVQVGLCAPYTVTFQSAAGTQNLPAAQHVYPGDAATAPGSAPTRQGYTFDGWYTAATAGAVFDFAATLTADTTIYAHWTPDYTDLSYWAHITYGGNGNTGGTAPTSVFVPAGTNALVAGNTGNLTRLGYTFAGWNEDASGTGASHAALGTWTSIPAGEHTLYAAWTERDNYRVYYEVNLATSGAIATKTDVKWTDAGLLPANEPTRTGYDFAGWNVSAGGSKVGVTSSDSYAELVTSGTEPASLTLQAQWTAATYTVTYNGNDSDGGTAMGTGTATYNQSFTLATNTYTRTGYTFAGWATTTAGGGTQYSDGQSFNYLLSSDLILYASWLPTADNTLIFNANGGVVATLEFLTYNGQVTIPAYPTISRQGYTLKGWMNNNTDTWATYAEAGNSRTINWTGAKTVYAYWEANTYTISYDGNGADGGTAMTNDTAAYNVNISLAANTFTRTGYTFRYWADARTVIPGVTNTYGNQCDFWPYSSIADDIWDSSAQPGHEADLQLYAIWEANTYTISYDGNGATGGTMQASSVAYDQNGAFAANTFTRTGYTFRYWADARTVTPGVTNTYGDQYAFTPYATLGSAIWDSNAQPGHEADLQLYAIWEANQYTVTYNGNGSASASMPSGTATYGTYFALDDNTYTRSGYTFAGWATSSGNASAGTVAYANQAQFSPWLLALAGDSLDLYAVWMPRSYSVVYDGNGSTGASMPSGTVTYGTNFVLDANTYTRPGYTFAGWATTPLAAAAGTIAHANQAQFNPWLLDVFGGTYTLYASWTPDYSSPYWKSVTFIAGSGGSLDAAGSLQPSVTFANVPEGTTWGAASFAVPTPTPQDSHYRFSGWSPALPSAGDAITANLTYTALFTLDSHTLSYVSTAHTSGAVSGAQSATHGSMVTVAGPGSLARTGYTFAGWSLSAGGALSYGSGASVQLTGDMVLYALWNQNPVPPVVQPSTYLLTYAPGAASAEVSGLPASASGLAAGTTVVVAAAPTRAGYTFTGWAASTGGTYQAQDTFVMPAADVVLTATWEQEVTYRLTYLGNGNTAGNAPLDERAYHTGESARIAEAGSLARTGYTFAGWAASASATTAAYKAGDTLTVTSDVTLYAVWQAVEERATAATPSTPTTVTTISEGRAISDTLRSQLNEADIVLLEQQSGNPLVDLFSGAVPMGGFSISGARSLLSLICAAVSALLALVVLATLLIRSFRQKRRVILAAAGLVAGGVAVVLWVLFENNAEPFIWITQHTLPVLIATGVGVALAVSWFVATKRSKTAAAQEHANA